MAGLFFKTPQEVMQAQSQRAFDRGMMQASLPAGRGGVAAAGMTGGMLGQAASQALGGSPEMQKAQQMQELQQRVEASGIDITSQPDEYLTFAAKEAQSMGLSQEAFEITNQLTQMRSATAKAGREEREVKVKEAKEERETKAAKTSQWFKTMDFALKSRNLDLIEKRINKGREFSPIVNQIAELNDLKKKSYIESYNAQQPGANATTLEDLPPQVRMRYIEDLINTITEANMISRFSTVDLPSEITRSYNLETGTLE